MPQIRRLDDGMVKMQVVTDHTIPRQEYAQKPPGVIIAGPGDGPLPNKVADPKDQIKKARLKEMSDWIKDEEDSLQALLAEQAKSDQPMPAERLTLIAQLKRSKLWKVSWMK